MSTKINDYRRRPDPPPQHGLVSGGVEGQGRVKAVSLSRLSLSPLSPSAVLYICTPVPLTLQPLVQYHE